MLKEQRPDRKPLLAVINENSDAILNYGNFNDRFCDSAIVRISIEDWFASREKDPEIVTIDARSEAEFAEDHLPGAISFPILDNPERDEVGFLYKQVSPAAAYFWAEKIAGKKLDSIQKLADRLKGCQVVVYCWRGGGRSTALAHYLIKFGLSCVKIRGGYKSYRSFVHSSFYQEKAQDLSFLVLTGLTGCGKTQIIEHLKGKVPSLDIEAAACHASSLFGHIRYADKEVVSSQTEFENRLFAQLLDHCQHPEMPYLTEGESKSVSTFQIPDALYKRLKESPAIRVNASLESRVERIKAEYFADDKILQVIEILNKSRFFKMLLGSQEINRLANLLEIGRVDEFCEWFLTNYYDRRYAGIYSNIIATIDHKDLEQSADEILIFLKKAKYI